MTVDQRLSDLLSIHESERQISLDHIRLSLLIKMTDLKMNTSTQLTFDRSNTRRKLLLAMIIVILLSLISYGVFAFVIRPSIEEKYPDLTFPLVTRRLIDADKQADDEILGFVQSYQSNQEILIIRNLEKMAPSALHAIGEIVGGSSSIDRSAGVNTLLAIYYGGKIYHLYYYETNQEGFSDLSNAEILALLEDDLNEFIKNSIIIDQTGEYPDLD